LSAALKVSLLEQHVLPYFRLSTLKVQRFEQIRRNVVPDMRKEQLLTELHFGVVVVTADVLIWAAGNATYLHRILAAT
jgi:hypothetical protein